jgi:EpsI family protein
LSADQPRPVPAPTTASAPLARRARSGRRGDPRLALALAASLLLAGLACRELLRFPPAQPTGSTLAGEVEEWFFEPSDSSPLVILVLCGWLVWRRRARLAPLWGRQGPWVLTAGFWLAAIGIFGWAVRAGAPDLQAIALVPTLLGAANLLGGPAAVRVMGLPAAVLAFAVPVPAPLLNQILWRLQIWTADFTGFLLETLSFPVLVSGDRIIMRDGLFAIIETCSGLRSIETLALLAILMIDLFGRRGLHAWILLLASPLVAFLINGLRCLGLIFNPHADIASIHNLQGIAMLLGGVLLLYFLDGALARLLAEPAPISAFERRVRAQPAERATLAPRAALLVGFSALLVALSWLPRFGATPVGTHTPANVVETEFDGWRGVPQETDWVFLGKVGFGQIVHRHYTQAAEAVDLFIGQAGASSRMRSYLSPKVAFPGSGWIVEREEPTEIAGRPATLAVLRKGSVRMLVVHWFEASPGVAAESARALLSLDTTAWARHRIPLAVRLGTPLAGTQERAFLASRARLERFAERVAPALKILSAPRATSPAGKAFSQ